MGFSEFLKFLTSERHGHHGSHGHHKDHGHRRYEPAHYDHDSNKYSQKSFMSDHEYNVRNLCSQCSIPVQPGSKFCPNCGNLLKLFSKCQACGVEVMPKASFCHECGAKVK